MLRDERRRADADDAPLPAAHPGRRPHRQHGVDRRTAGLSERLLVRGVEVRGAGLHVRTARGSAGRPIRVTTVDAGLVETEFSVVRFRGDEEAAKSVYAGLDPVTPDEVADCVLFALTRPPHVNIDEIVVKALAQSSGARIVRAE